MRFHVGAHEHSDVVAYSANVLHDHVVRCVQVAAPYDAVTNANVPWTDDRPDLQFETITVTSRIDDQVPKRRKVIFDPDRRVDAIAPSGDPLSDVCADVSMVSGRPRSFDGACAEGDAWERASGPAIHACLRYELPSRRLAARERRGV